MSSSEMTMSGMMLPHSAIESLIQSDLPTGDYLVNTLELLTSSSMEAAAAESSSLQAALDDIISANEDHPSVPSFLGEMTYLGEIFSLFPSMIPAESQIAYSVTKSPSVVSELSLAATKPLDAAGITSISTLENEHPSLEAAFYAVTRAEVSFPEVTTLQHDLTDIEQSDPSIISQFQAVNTLLTTQLPRMTTVVLNIPCIDAENEIVRYVSLGELSPSLSTDLDELHAMELSSESLRSAENGIATALLQNPSVVAELSEAYLGSASSLPSLSSLEKSYSYLANYFKELSSAEITHPTLVSIQSAFDQAILEDSSLFLRQLTMEARSSPTLFSAEQSISEAEVSHPSIVSDIDYVDALELSTPTLIIAEAELDDMTMACSGSSCSGCSNCGGSQCGCSGCSDSNCGGCSNCGASSGNSRCSGMASMSAMSGGCAGSDCGGCSNCDGSQCGDGDSGCGGANCGGCSDCSGSCGGDDLASYSGMASMSHSMAMSGGCAGSDCSGCSDCDGSQCGGSNGGCGGSNCEGCSDCSGNCGGDLASYSADFDTLCSMASMSSSMAMPGGCAGSDCSGCSDCDGSHCGDGDSGCGGANCGGCSDCSGSCGGDDLASYSISFHGMASMSHSMAMSGGCAGSDCSGCSDCDGSQCGGGDSGCGGANCGGCSDCSGSCGGNDMSGMSSMRSGACTGSDCAGCSDCSDAQCGGSSGCAGSDCSGCSDCAASMYASMCSGMMAMAYTSYSVPQLLDLEVSTELFSSPYSLTSMMGMASSTEPSTSYYASSMMGMAASTKPSTSYYASSMMMGMAASTKPSTTYVASMMMGMAASTKPSTSYSPSAMSMMASSSSASSSTTAVHEIQSVEESHPLFASMQSSIEDVEQSVPSIFTDVSELNDAESPSLVQAEASLETGEVTTALLLSEVSYIDLYEVSYPSWIAAESTIESYEVESPSAVTDVKLYLSASSEPDEASMNTFVGSHSALLSALQTISSLTDYSIYLARIQDTLESAEQTVTSLLTDVSRIMRSSSPSEYTAIYKLESYEYTMPSLLSDLYYVNNINQLFPSLNTANAQVAQAEALSSSIVPAVNNNLEGVSDQALPSSLQTAVQNIQLAEKSFPSLSDIEPSLLYVERDDSSILSDLTTFQSDYSRVSSEMITVPAVVCTVMIPNVVVFD